MTDAVIVTTHRLTSRIAMIPGVISVEHYKPLSPADPRYGVTEFIISTDKGKHRIEMSNELAEDTRRALDCVRQALHRWEVI